MNIVVSSSIKNKGSLGGAQIFKSTVWFSWETCKISMYQTVLVIPSHLVFTTPVSVMLGLGTEVVTISFSLQRKDSKAVLSGDTFEQFAVHTAQHPKMLRINMLQVLHSGVSFHINLSFKEPVGRVLPFSCPESAKSAYLHTWTQDRTFHVPRVASEVSLCVLN